MDEAKKKPVMIGIIVVCLVAAVGISYFTRDNTTNPKGANNPRPFICTNCGADFELTPEEVKEEVMALGPAARMMQVFDCPECSEKAAVPAYRCAKCEIVFAPSEAEDARYTDRCPECGYSAFEERASRKE